MVARVETGPSSTQARGSTKPPVVSDPTQPFQLAGFFDPDAPARPIRIALPIDTSPAGLRTIFRYHRTKADVPAGHPHALRHSFGTALAEAGVDLAVLQALMGHDHVDSAAAYIHLAPAHIRRAYDEARARQRSREPLS